MLKLCQECRHGEKGLIEHPCNVCIKMKGSPYWEPEYNDNPYWKRICAIADKQREKGISKYGQGLESNPADILARINHIQEELIDGLMYLEWAKEALTESE